jgi:hypothetical protein
LVANFAVSHVLGTNAPLILVLFFAFIWLTPTRIEIGADGIVIRWLWQQQFIPIADVYHASVEHSGWGGSKTVDVVIARKSDGAVHVRLGSPWWNDKKATAIVQQILAVAATAERGEIEHATAVLARNRRPVKEWIHGLRAIGAGANASLRTAPVDPEHLWRIVETPTAPGSDRAAAAVALSVALDAADRRRLRLVAASVAQPRVRAAIDAAAAGDDTAIEEALQRAGADEARE